MAAFDELLHGAGTVSATVGETARATGRAFRSGRVGPAIVVATVLCAAGCLVTVEAIGMLTGGRAAPSPGTDPIGWALRTGWPDPWLRVVGIVLLAVGAVLLGLALAPGGTDVIPLAGADPAVVSGVTRDGVACAVAHAVAPVVMGTHPAACVRVVVRRHRVRVLVGVPPADGADRRRLAPDTDAPAARARVAATSALAALDTAIPLRVRVRVSRVKPSRGRW